MSEWVKGDWEVSTFNLRPFISSLNHPVQHSGEFKMGDIAAAESGLTSEEEEQIKRHLERLGYL